MKIVMGRVDPNHFARARIKATNFDSRASVAQLRAGAEASRLGIFSGGDLGALARGPDPGDADRAGARGYGHS
jgi:hypothetical protein